jgi:hypothetical protein
MSNQIASMSPRANTSQPPCQNRIAFATNLEPTSMPSFWFAYKINSSHQTSSCISYTKNNVFHHGIFSHYLQHDQKGQNGDKTMFPKS